MRRLARALTIVVLVSLAMLSALPALAHVTIHADDTSPGGFAKYTVRVPSESEDAATVRVEIQLPEGYEEVRYQPLEGWDISVGDGVLTIEGGRIEPGEFQEFAFSARNPEQVGDVEFPAIQVYEDGEEVRWVGAADSDEPAPVVTIANESADDQAADTGATSAPEPAVTTEPAEPTATEPVDDTTEPAEDVAAPVTPDADDDGGSDVLSIIALVAGLLGLGVGGAAFARTRNTAP